MKELNNFNKVKNLFNFDKTYCLIGFIIIRLKDVHMREFDNSEMVPQEDIKMYTFRNEIELIQRKYEIIEICKSLGARFYLYPKPLKIKKLSFDTIRYFTEVLNKEDFRTHNNLMNYDVFMKTNMESDYPIDYMLIDLDEMRIFDIFTKVIKDNNLNIYYDAPSVKGHHYLLDSSAYNLLYGHELLEHYRAISFFDLKPGSPVLLYYYQKGELRKYD